MSVLACFHAGHDREHCTRQLAYTAPFRKNGANYTLAAVVHAYLFRCPPDCLFHDQVKDTESLASRFTAHRSFSLFIQPFFLFRVFGSDQIADTPSTFRSQGHKTLCQPDL